MKQSFGCNCGGKRRKPLGARPNGPADTTTTTQPRMQGKTQSFTLQTSNGRETFGSRLEAEAAKRRAGGGVIR